MSEQCCKHNPMLGPPRDEIEIVEHTIKQHPYKNQFADETKHPAFPKGDISKCPVMGAGMKAAEGIDWHAKYLQAQRDIVEEAGRWSKRVQDLEVAYAEKIMRMQREYDSGLEEGFEEAYKMVLDQRNKYDAELKAAEKVAEQGYNEAWGIIQELQKTNVELGKQLSGQIEASRNEYDGVIADDTFLEALKNM